MIETQIVGERVAGEAAKVKKQLADLIAKVQSSKFDIAELLHKVKLNGFYKPEFDTYNEYAKTLGLEESSAFYLPKIIDVMEQVEIDRNTYEPLGTSKMREITSLDPHGFWTNPETKEITPMKEFITHMVEKGNEMKLDDIKKHVRTLKGFVGANDIVNKTFGWPRSTFDETIVPAIELAKRNIGSTGRDEEGNAVDASDSRAVEVWAIEYTNDPANNTLSEEETNGPSV